MSCWKDTDQPTDQPATAITCKEGHVIMLSWPAEQLLAIIGEIIASVVCSMACCVECFDLATIRGRLLQIWSHSRRCAHTRHIWLSVNSLLLDTIDSSATLFLFLLSVSRNRRGDSCYQEKKRKTWDLVGKRCAIGCCSLPCSRIAS